MKIRPIVDADMIDLARWFELRKWPLPPVDRIIPKLGLVAVTDGQMVACAWIYENESAFAPVDWIATNPFVDEKVGMAGLVLVIESLKDATRSKETKVRTLQYVTQNDKLASRFERCGFRKESGFHRLIWTSKKAR